MTRKLVIFSGPDRCGKSTLVQRIQEYLGEDNCMTFHHGAPPHDPENIFDFYRDHIVEWVSSGNEWCLFDRAYPCSYALEDSRRHNNGHLDDIIDLELELMQCAFKVIHVFVSKPWNWSAQHHVVELKELFPSAPPWKLRDEYVARQKEHRIYTEKLEEFYEHLTAFPCVYHFDSMDKPRIDKLIANINFEIQ